MQDNNDKIEFIAQYGSDAPRISMVLSPNSTLGEVLEAFEAFLLAAGYVFDGTVCIDGNVQDVKAEEN